MRAPGLGGERLLGLVEKFGGIAELVSARPAELRRAGLAEESINAFRNHDEGLLEKDLQWLSARSHHLLTADSEIYPPLLRDIPSRPAALYVDGDAEALWQPQVAVIGSRNPTSGGIDNARDFAAELSRLGMTVTSGMASGIDSVAHLAAMDSGGKTIAVLGTGIDLVYPRSAEALAERIRAQGALVSEFPPGTAAKREHFPSRNRIISGLSLGVLVIEAGLRSGTLITARLAGGQGRDVFALPGSIHNPMAKGCHRLIRDGARLVENVAEIMAELAPLAGKLASALSDQLEERPADRERERLELASSEPQFDWDSDYRSLWSCLGYDPKPVDLIIEQSGLTAPAVSAMLLMLELRGLVEAHAGGAYSRKPRGK